MGSTMTDLQPASPLDRRMPQLDDVIDSYDEDLGWILDRFLERAGAAACAITIHDRIAATSRMLSIRGDLTAEVDQDLIVDAAAACTRLRAAPDERFASVELTLGGRPCRVFSLWLSADDHHEVVVSVCFDPQAAAAMLIPIVTTKFQPVLGGYFKLWLLARAYRRRMTAMRAALDHTDLGIFLIDRQGRLVLANAAGAALLDEGDGLRRAGPQLAAVDAAADRKLRPLFSGQDLDGVGAPLVVALPRSGSRRPLLVSVLPITRAPIDSADASCVVYVFNPEIDVRALLAPVCQAYRLSPSEARLLTLVASGDNVAEAAQGLGVKEQTVRAYLKNIFLKTGTTRQADLVRVVMSSLVRLRVTDDWKVSPAWLIASAATMATFGMMDI